MEIVLYFYKSIVCPVFLVIYEDVATKVEMTNAGVDIRPKTDQQFTSRAPIDIYSAIYTIITLSFHESISYCSEMWLFFKNCPPFFRIVNDTALVISFPWYMLYICC